MKLFRPMALLLALGAFSVCGKLTSAQQDVAPDFFDQKPMQSQPAQVKNPKHSHATAHTTTANKRSSQAKHHRAHIAA